MNLITSMCELMPRNILCISREKHVRFAAVLRMRVHKDMYRCKERSDARVSVMRLIHIEEILMEAPIRWKKECNGNEMSSRLQLVLGLENPTD